MSRRLGDPLRLWPELTGEVAELVSRVDRFIHDTVIPAELPGDEVPGDDVRQRLRQAARDAGIFGPQVSHEYGGLGLTWAQCVPVFEAAGYSLLGPAALNCAAPDEGNIHLLAKVANPEQAERYLAPLARGQVRSAFAMTEPAPGAGSDPRALRTVARRDGDDWVIDGHKWFTTGARGAAFAICMARTSGEPGQRGGATMFLVDADNPGMRVVRDLDTIDHSFAGGHGEVIFDGCRVSDAAVLGAVDEGFRYAQVRLEPARLTHCMRWLGIARRAHDIALQWCEERSLFGSRLGELGLAQQLIADSEIDLTTARALVYQSARRLDLVGSAGKEVSITKTFVAEAVCRVVDRAIQLCGGRGVSRELPLERFWREVRPLRIYDGPSEVHRWSIARLALRERREARP